MFTIGTAGAASHRTTTCHQSSSAVGGGVIGGARERSAAHRHVVLLEGRSFRVRCSLEHITNGGSFGSSPGRTPVCSPAPLVWSSTKISDKAKSHPARAYGRVPGSTGLEQPPPCHSGHVRHVPARAAVAGGGKGHRYVFGRHRTTTATNPMPTLCWHEGGLSHTMVHISIAGMGRTGREAGV